MPAQIFGAQAAVTMLNRAFNNTSPSNAVFNNQVANATAMLPAGANAADANSYTAFAKTFGASYASMTAAAAATQLLTNMGVLPSTVASVQALEGALASYLTSVGMGNVGVVALQLGSIISGLESATGDLAVYSSAATAWNNEVTAAYTYSSSAASTAPSTGDTVAPPATQGQTFTLTTGQDNVQGTGGNDTILGVFDGGATSNQNTLTAADVINGGAGTDSLYATLDVGSTGVLPAAQYSNIENFFIRNVSGVNPANTFNFASYSGEEQVWNDRSSNAVVVTGLAAGTTVGVKGNGAAVAGATNATYAATATEAKIALDGGIATGSAAVTVNGGAGLTSATLTSTGAANSIGGLNLAAATTALTVDAQSNVATGAITGAGLTSITVKGAGSANLSNAGGAALPGTVTTLNAADNAGGVTAVLNGQTNFKFTGGAGNDVVTTGAVLVATASVDAGAGTADRLVVANTNHIRVDGTSKALGDLYKGFEQVQVQNGVNLNVANLSTNNTIDTVRINDTSGTTSVTGISAAAAQNVTILNAQGGITIGLAGATTTGQIDTVKAAVTTTTTTPVPALQNVSLQSVNLAGVENLELTGSNGPIAANVGRIVLDTTNAIDLASIKLNNANAVDNNGANDNVIVVSAGSRAINLNIDATGSGDTQISAAAYNTITGATLTTGAGNDFIIGSARADVINGGAGDDILIGGDFVAPGALTPATADEVRYDFTGAPVVVGDKVTVTIGGQLYTATATSASPLNLANALANAIATGPANANIASATVVGNTVVVTGTATGLAANLTAGANAVITSDPAAGVNLATGVTTLIPAANATAANSTFTFNTAAGSFAVGETIAYTIDDGNGGSSETVTYTVGLADVIGGDGAATAANIASKVAAQFNAAAAAVTAVRVGNVVTVTSNNAGQSGNDQSWSAVPHGTNTATGVVLNEVSNGTDATAQTVRVDFTGLNFATGDVVTLNWTDDASQSVSYTVLAGDTATQVAAGLDAAWGAGATANVNNALGVLTIQDASAAGVAATITTVSTTIDRAPLVSANVAVARTEGADAVQGAPVVTAAADRLTGGEGNDVFVVNYSNIDAAGTDLVNRVTFSAMDTITDLNLGGNVAGTNVDTIDLPFAVGTLVNAGTPVAMAATAADLFDAVQALYAAGGTMASAAAGTAGLFTYGGNTYLIADQNGFVDGFAQNDIIINVTGVTGTLNLTDLV